MSALVPSLSAKISNANAINNVKVKISVYVCTYPNKIELNTRMVSSPNAYASTSEREKEK